MQALKAWQSTAGTEGAAPSATPAEVAAMSRALIALADTVGRAGLPAHELGDLAVAVCERLAGGFG
ncbi:MAG: hypothetical protein ACRYG8_09930 [Janthinobacterium lividum]